MSYDLMMRQALKYHDEGQWDKALNLYQQILETTPNHPIVLNLTGLALQSKGLHKQATVFFSKAIIQNPQSAEYYFNLAWSEERCGEIAEALKSYQQALKLQPNIKEAYNALGNIYLTTNNIDKAKKNYETALTLDPSYVEPQANLAKIDNDIPQLMSLEKKYPYEALIPYYLALILRNNHKIEEALEAAKRAEKLQSHEEYLLLTAELYLDCEKKHIAADYFQRVLAINPKSVTALINLANMELDSITAEKFYKKALDIEPDNIDAHINYANFLYQEKRLNESLEEYRQAVILDPKRSEISNNLGIIQKDLGEYDEALGLFLNALFKQPLCKEYTLNIAETLILLSQTDKNKAAKIAANWQQKMPDNIFACRLNEILNEKDSENTINYTRELFNQFAENFEQLMTKLNYQLPQKIADLLGEITGTIIDLGCGTGLIGAVLKNNNNKLIGVDISSAMLKQAKLKNIYDMLIEDDINNYCRQLPPANFVIAADVFGYIGKLDSIIEKVFPRNFCFSIAVDNTCKNYKLTNSGRYCHNSDYVKKLLHKAGYLNILEYQTQLRQEKGEPVQGIIFIAKEY